jgi:ABC-2 type transport system ATP-binding protein
MSAAVVVNEASKQFVRPVNPALNRRPRFNGSNSSHLANGSEQPSAILAVDRVSFSVREGEIFGLYGAADSGKSTLIHMLGTLLIPDAGELRVFGYDVVRHTLQVQRLINRVSVQASFFKQLSPLQNLLNGSHLLGLQGRQVRDQVIEMLLQLGLDDLDLYRPMEAMTRSMQQMVTIARALLSRPRLLLLDEPTSGLDTNFRRNVHKALHDMRDLHHTTILIATADALEANCLCDRVAVMKSGRLMAVDTPYGLSEQPIAGGCGFVMEKTGPCWTSSIVAADE